MEYVLRSRKLWSLVVGDKERPSDAAGRKEWDEQDEEARQVIVMTVFDSQNSYLFDETSAKGMWDRLKEAHQEVSVANTLRLKSTFNAYKKDPKHTITMHVTKVKEMVQELKAVGVTIPKEDIILILLDSLPEEYRLVKSSLKSQKWSMFVLASKKKNMTWDWFLKRKRKRHCQRLENKVQEELNAIIVES